MEMSRRYLDDAAVAAEIDRIVDGKFKARIQPGSSQTQPYGAMRFEHFDQLAEALNRTSSAIGRVPAGPATLRAKFGASVIRALQRILFWYTLQIQSFHTLAADAFQQLLYQIKTLHAQNSFLQREVEELRSQIETTTAELQDQLSQLRAHNLALAARLDACSTPSRQSDSHLNKSAPRTMAAAEGASPNGTQKALASLSASVEDDLQNLRDGD